MTGTTTPPPRLSGSGEPILTGSDGRSPRLSGSGEPILTGPDGPPPRLSGSGEPILTGSDGRPPRLSGSGGPILTGSGGPPPPPPCPPGSGLPASTFEALTIRVAFTATSGTTTSANGVLQAVSLSGTDHGSLGLRTTGLPDGTYTVSAVADAGNTPITVGTFDIPIPTISGSTTAEHKAKADPRKPGPIPIPSSLDPFEIASLAISDSNANVLFTATLEPLSDGAFYARTPLVSGTSVPEAKGVAQIQAFAKAGVVQGTLTLHASGLPATTTYTYAVNGTDIATVTTGSAGSLKLVATEQTTGGTLPDTVDLFTVTTVTVHDGSGNVILSASF